MSCQSDISSRMIRDPVWECVKGVSVNNSYNAMSDYRATQCSNEKSHLLTNYTVTEGQIDTTHEHTAQLCTVKTTNAHAFITKRVEYRISACGSVELQN